MAHQSETVWRIPVVALLVVHCNDASSSKMSETEATTTTAPQDSETTPTGGGASMGGETAGGASHAICERYLGCLAVTVPEALPAAQQGYADNGTCWQAGVDAAEQCLMACRIGLAQTHDLYPDEPACSECAHDEECDAGAGEVCASAGVCAVLCVDELPWGCVCRGDADCAGDHVCVEEACKTSLTCGDGKVGADEICDGQDGCDADCAGPLQCNPLTNLGCAAGQVCHIDGACKDAPGALPGAGEACQYQPNKATCAVGHVCEMDYYYQQDCAYDGCCVQLCNLADDEYDCPGDQYCTPGSEMLPELAFVGFCL